MSHPLKAKIASLRGRVRRLVAVYGLSRMATAVLTVLLLVGLADYLVRFQDRGIRLIASAAVVAVIGWAAYRYLLLPLAVRFRDVDLARRVARRYPALGDRLASAVEFLDQPEDDALGGSAALRRAVIAEATAESEGLDFHAAVEPGPSWKAAAAALILGLVAAIVVVVDPLSSRIALARLANPFGRTAWPQTTHLTLRHRVDRVAKGRAFEVEVIDRFGARLPSSVRMHYRIEDADGNVTEETQPMHLVDDVLVARRENVAQPFSYRAEGGDDDSMPWIPVEVLDPPAVASLTVKLVPPEYTGWPEDQTDGNIRALVGTRVEVSATVSTPTGAERKLAAATLVMEDGRRVPGTIVDEGRGFTIPAAGAEPLVIERSGGYWFELVDSEGLTAGTNREPRWEIRAVEDAAPTVTIEQPSSTVFVTPGAVVPLRVAVKDDLAVHRIALEFERSDRPGQDPAVVPLDEGPPQAAASAGLSGGADLGESRLVTYNWDLAPLSLAPTTQLTFRATATDYRPQDGASQPRRVVVITPEELADRIAARQAFILSELARVLEMERTSRSQVATLGIRLGEIGRLDQLDLDHLHGAELTERQVERSLTSTSEGVPMHVLGLLADLENNKIDSPDVRRRMEALLAEIGRLERDELPVIARDLTAAIKAATISLEEAGAEKPPVPDAAVAKPLAAAGEGQDRVIAALEKVLGDLSRWDDFRRFHRDVGQLVQDQEELARRTAELARRTLSKDLKDLLPQEAADLKIAAREQLELARRLDRIQQAMQASVGQLEESDPLAAETLSDAVHRAAELAVAAGMRAAGERVEQNRMGQAMAGQKQALEDLREVLDILANRRESELARLVRKLRQAETDLAELARQQQALRDQLQQAAGQSDNDGRRQQLERLARQQEEIQAETERTERRLQRLTAEQAAQSAGQAAEKMQAAGTSAHENKGPEAGSQADQAHQKLEEARRQLAAKRRQAELDLAQEQFTRLEDTLKSVRLRQQKAIDETARLDGLKQTQGQLSDAQAATLGQVAREQRMLGQETGAMIDDLSAAEVLRLALSDAQEGMSRAAAMLDRRQTGTPTRSAQQSALVRLDQLLKAVQPEKPQEGSSNSGGGQGGQSEAPPGDAIQALAEIKLLKLLQEEVNTRTRQLEDRFGPVKNLPDDARREYTELSRQQGRLADLLLNLVPAQQDPAANPESLDDLLEPSRRPSDMEEMR